MGFDKIVLLGGGYLLLDIAKWCKSQGWSTFVITAPRHAQELIQGHTLAACLAQADIPFYNVETLNEVLQEDIFNDFTQSLAISFGAAWIFKKDVIENKFCNRLFNAHGTRLPTYRGGGGFSWQILNKNRYGISLLHQIDEGVDTGKILAIDEFLFPATCRIPADYEAVYLSQTKNFLQKTLQAIYSGKLALDHFCVAQPEYLSQYWPRLNTELHAWLDWSWTVEQLDNFICAFDDPYPGAKTLLNGKKVVLKKSCIDYHEQAFHPFQWGLVYRNNGKWLCVAAQGGSLIIESVINEDGDNILAGIRTGERLFTPVDYLATKAERAFYTPRK